MKILKKIGLSIVAFFISIKTLALKVYAKTTFDAMSACDYGIEPLQPTSTEESIVAVVAKIFGTIIIPIALLVGIVVYLVKSKSKVWKKVIITLGIVIVYTIFAIVMNNL